MFGEKFGEMFGEKFGKYFGEKFREYLFSLGKDHLDLDLDIYLMTSFCNI